jgi:hypothetical protein
MDETTRFGQLAAVIKGTTADLRQNFQGAGGMASWVKVLDCVAQSIRTSEPICVVPTGDLSDIYLMSEAPMVAHSARWASVPITWVTQAPTPVARIFERMNLMKKSDKDLPEHKRSFFTGVKLLSPGKAFFSYKSGSTVWACAGFEDIVDVLKGLEKEGRRSDKECKSEQSNLTQHRRRHVVIIFLAPNLRRCSTEEAEGTRREAIEICEVCARRSLGAFDPFPVILSAP